MEIALSIGKKMNSNGLTKRLALTAVTGALLLGLVGCTAPVVKTEAPPKVSTQEEVPVELTSEVKDTAKELFNAVVPGKKVIEQVQSTSVTVPFDEEIVEKVRKHLEEKDWVIDTTVYKPGVITYWLRAEGPDGGKERVSVFSRNGEKIVIDVHGVG